VKWAGEKLDDLRRRTAGELRAAGRGGEAGGLGKGGMWALRKDYKKLSPGQRGSLAQIAVTNKPLYKGYLIKEQIREAFKVKGDQGKSLMRGVTAWAHRCRIPEFTKLAKTLSRYSKSIEATLDGGPSNGRASYCAFPCCWCAVLVRCVVPGARGPFFRGAGDCCTGV